MNKKNIRNPENNKLYEAFQNEDDNSGSVDRTKPLPNKFKNQYSDRWDIKLHKDFKNYISKEECDVKVSKFAKKDKCGNTIPCTIPKCKTMLLLSNHWIRPYTFMQTCSLLQC